MDTTVYRHSGISTTVLQGSQWISNVYVENYAAANGILFTTPQYSGLVSHGVSSGMASDAMRSVQFGKDLYSANYYPLLLNNAALIELPANNSTVGASINDATGLNNVRALMTVKNAPNTYSSLQASPSNNLTVSVDEPRDAAGELTVQFLTPTLQLFFGYDYTTQFVYAFTSSSAAVVQSGALAVCSTGATANSRGMLESLNRLPTVPGQGVITKIAAVFGAPAAGCFQQVGIGNNAEGAFFGYNGTVFGALVRSAGVFEVRRLTLTSVATLATLTLTLNGIATSIATTVGASIHTLVYAIASTAALSNSGTGWRAYPDGNSVVLVASVAETRTGTYSLTGAGGTFTQVCAGVPVTSLWYPQTLMERGPMRRHPHAPGPEPAGDQHVPGRLPGRGLRAHHLLDPAGQHWQVSAGTYGVHHQLLVPCRCCRGPPTHCT